MKIILLGPQRRPTVDAVVRSLRLAGPVATVTAGWQEREGDDGELSARLGGRDVNLRLYRRWLEVQDRDVEYAAGERSLAGVLAELQELYLLRLDYALRAVYAVQRRAPGFADEAIEAVRELDAAHLRRIGGVRGEFFDRLRPHERPVIAEHRAAITELLAGSAAVVVAGGHVGVLADVLHLFNVGASLRPADPDRAGPDRPVIAWSAGAMALADRIVLFHDRSAHGPGHPEVYGRGLSLLRGVVLLPHARARLLLGDAERMAVFTRRFGPARCVPLENGARIEVGEGGAWPPGVRVLGPDGRTALLEAS